MAPRPAIALGQYVQTRFFGKTRCKAYTAPPPWGAYICTIEQGSFLGPIQEVIESREFTTVLVKGYFINVWAKSQRAQFARVVPLEESEAWCRRGWAHQ